ncbi:peptide-methionine (S)-S-oxide reductase MsrA [Flavobacterium selenitireducens]|uniref:peptide-methionine (S)-S-oxide reductase MsrA n=1 Tax=Flavobacterium selenitireducens TaxID=2722704 RepID=UPI00168B9162|nr:peptide-methionine (S)-S-oxide reductase MsrA [Flavobacterium selenitireducens]MBD3581495.1 peptide-methionine (S)-S-oxide reductase MsrA [Flavobacterium selenitireducens]
MKKLIFLPMLAVFFSCMAKEKQQKAQENHSKSIELSEQQGLETATFGGGCFWCTEAVFLEIDGVKSVVSGYIGGKTVNPTYNEVSSGDTGHAEAVQITYDPKKLDFGELLEIFFATHDPTTLNRQGNDVGTQYRSEIFYHTAAQKELSEAYIQELEKESTYGFGKKVVTKVTKAPTFYPAEDYHQNYYAQNKQQPYCSFVITPKVEKVREKYKAQLKHQK